MAEKVTLTIGDQTIELPVVVGTEGERAIDISELRAKTGMVTYDPSFGNTASCSSAITFIDGDKGILRYRGIPIEQFVDKPNFVEVAWLLIFGRLPNRDELQHELQALLPMQQALEFGRTLRQLELTPEQRRATKAFQLFSDKPRLVVINTSDAEDHPERFSSLTPPETPSFAFSLGLEMELEQMEPTERTEFCREMEVHPFDRDHLIRCIMDTSGQMLFFTAGDKEVRTWMIQKDGTALEAAANIHTDLAQGFIRAETMKVADLVRLGSEREIKAHNLLRQEPKDYVIQDDDILFIRHN